MTEAKDNLSIVDYNRLEQLLSAGLGSQYADASPFPHIMIDNFLLEDVAVAAADEAKITKIPVDPNFYGSFEKFKLSDSSQFGPVVARISEELNSPQFLAWVARLTGIDNLLDDETLEGGGIHRIGTGGFLKVHTDFNFHRVSGLHRRLNLLIYLNPTWQSEWGGRLELWQTDMSGKAASYEPLFNRAVIFSTTDESYHGHPDPLQTPNDVYRHSLAYYYYTDTPGFQSRFGESEMTNYRARPGEKFGIKHAIHQLMIRVPFVRPALDKVKKVLFK